MHTHIQLSTILQKKGKMPEEALQIAVNRREVKGKEKRKDIPI